MDDRLISLNAAIDALNKKWRTCIIGESLIRDAGDTLKALPSSQPDVPDTNVGDMISRQGVLRLLNAVPSEEFATKAMLISGVNALPPAYPGWIPWDSGRFPEESGTYTVTAYDGATKRVTYAKYQKRLKRWKLTGAMAYWRVLAWQPLPTPYREGGQNDGET